jgi:hypothetical protein
MVPLLILTTSSSRAMALSFFCLAISEIRDSNSVSSAKVIDDVSNTHKQKNLIIFYSYRYLILTSASIGELAIKRVHILISDHFNHEAFVSDLGLIMVPAFPCNE